MSFASLESSRTKGEPIILFRFAYSDDGVTAFAYTTAEEAVSHGGDTYVPIAISSAEIVSSGTLDNAVVEITATRSSGLTPIYTAPPPSRILLVEVMEAHASDLSDVKFRWSGRLTAFRCEGSEIILSCEPISTALRRSGLRRHYGYTCPHILYGTQCGASKAAATADFTVSSVDGAFVKLPDAWSTVQTQYQHGLAEWTDADGHLRRSTILRSDTATVLVFAGDTSTLLAGHTVTLSKGCNHQMTDCTTIHDNIVNFGGQPWIPTTNPVGVVDNYY